jgi:SAM-dependent methyltransferase
MIRVQPISPWFPVLMKTASQISAAVQQLYNTYPFPADPLSDQPPPGYNWRWSWPAAYHFCTGQTPPQRNIRILDAGCGTGSGTEYLSYLNPEATVVAVDLSEEALAVAQERYHRSGILQTGIPLPQFYHLSLVEVSQLEGEFDFINCVGVLHHLPDPQAGIQALASKLAAGGLLHIFVYAELGRWEIRLMQRAIALLQGEERGDYRAGVQIGRRLFATLPDNNRLVESEKRRWALENQRDENFADMYLHPQEIDYTIETLFDLIAASGLEFLGFSDPNYWQLERLLGKDPALLERATHLSERERYQLVELLDPEISHYEFFLGKPPLGKMDWSEDALLLSAQAERSPCLHGWPSQNVMDYNYHLVHLSDLEYAFLQACDSPHSVGQILSQVDLTLDQVRSLQHRQLILLSPARGGSL